ncbi:cysteine-rich RLK (RECEPTOR-like protein kinase) 8 [Striga hermonthica]|uniref:Cysteine-rich RLK (RECEPTOR-like protein kinase) 8 n=1 Tax=Striga hermonthica TaxID=68872 RepID=A0A9N7NKR2_STRHE|nr:cysteine-rich RLK (RECEPTOR-like protein kinase) 8 [Striga hermonthica]
MAAPRTTHHFALRYVKGTLLHGLHFSTRSSLTLSDYSDADWTGDSTDRRSINGYCFFLGDLLVFWRSKKQTLVSRSSAESEYRALADSTSELLWLRRLLADLGAPQSLSTALHCDIVTVDSVSRASPPPRLSPESCRVALCRSRLTAAVAAHVLPVSQATPPSA